MISISIFWALFVAHLAKGSRLLSLPFSDPTVGEGRRTAG